jgi:hypothetical protein
MKAEMSDIILINNYYFLEERIISSFFSTFYKMNDLVLGNE